MSSPIHDPISPSRFLVDEHETASSPFPLTGSLQGRQYVEVHPESVHGEEMVDSPLAGIERKTSSIWSAVDMDAHDDEEDEIPSPYEGGEAHMRSMIPSSLIDGGRERFSFAEEGVEESRESTYEEMALDEGEQAGKRRRVEHVPAGFEQEASEEGKESNGSEKYLSVNMAVRSGEKKGKDWTEAEDQILKNGCRMGLTHFEMAAQLQGRSRSSVTGRIRLLERNGVMSISRRTHSQVHWTHKEIKMAQQLRKAGKIYRRIGKILGRSPHAVATCLKTVQKRKAARKRSRETE